MRHDNGNLIVMAQQIWEETLILSLKL